MPVEDFTFYIDRYIQYCTTNKKLARSTIKRYRSDLEEFLHFLETLDSPISGWAQVRRKHLDHYLEASSDRYAVTTIRGKFSCLRLFFYYLEEDGLEFDNPFRRFRLYLQKPSSIPISLTLGEVTSILREAYKSENLNDFQKARDLLVLELLFSGGMRVGELCGMELSRYDSVEQTFEVIGKGSKHRFIYITNRVVINVLENYLFLRNTLPGLNESSPGFSSLLITDVRRPLRAQHVRNIIKKYVDAAGITKRITPHTFRHTFASLLLEEGVDIKYIQEFLGHSSIKTTQIYLHTSNGRKKEILATMHPRRRLGIK